MDFENFFAFFYNEASKIYAICFDLDITDEQIRLLSFIHLKTIQNDINYFENPSLEEVQSLKIMLGDTELAKQILHDNNVDSEQIEKTIENCAKSFSKLDIDLKNKYGMENRISGELKYRLRLYTDSSFRKKILDLYKNKVLPLIISYTDDKVQKSFVKYQEKMQKKEDEFKQFLQL